MPFHKLVVFLLLITGCASPQPVLYPNEHSEEVGDEQVRKDIDECIQLAKDTGAHPNDTEKVVRETSESAAEGAATGAASGAVTGDAGTSAAARAVSRGVSRLFSSMKTVDKPNPEFQYIVERCLQEKGYEPAGWK